MVTLVPFGTELMLGCQGPALCGQLPFSNYYLGLQAYGKVKVFEKAAHLKKKYIDLVWAFISSKPSKIFFCKFCGHLRIY